MPDYKSEGGKWKVTKNPSVVESDRNKEIAERQQLEDLKKKYPEKVVQKPVLNPGQTVGGTNA